jgi:hypothetical protein
VIDHINGNHFDNNPNNLQKLTIGDHCEKTFIGKKNKERKEIDNTNYNREFYNRKSIYRFCEYCGKDFKGNHKTLYCSKKCKNNSFKSRNYKPCVKCGTLMRRSDLCWECRYPKNHKVRYIKKLSEKIDTYDIEVNGLNSFVAEGVVIHNSSHFRSALEYFADNEPFLQSEE